MLGIPGMIIAIPLVLTIRDEIEATKMPSPTASCMPPVFIRGESSSESSSSAEPARNELAELDDLKKE
jgi:hypothetical protein